MRRNVKGMSCLTLSQWRHLFESIPCHWVPGGKSCRRSWIDLRTSLIIKSSVKPKKVTRFTGNLVSLGLGPWDWVLNFTTVCLKLIHLCQMERQNSCIGNETNREEIIHLLVQSDPVTFSHVTMVGNSDSTCTRYWPCFLSPHSSLQVTLTLRLIGFD